jgi:hypothetical protein
MINDPRLEELTQWREEMINNQAKQEVEREITDLKSKYGNYDWTKDEGYGTLDKRVIKYALDRNINNLEDAFRAYMWDAHAANQKAEALRTAANNTQIKTKQGFVQNGIPAGSPKKNMGYNPNDDYNELANKAVAELS